MKFDGAFLTQALHARRAASAPALSVGAQWVCTDSRQDPAGALFVPLVGECFDGHDYLDDVLAAGAALCLSERPHDDARVVVVDDSLRALQDIAHAHLLRLPGRRVALTGSNGKTSTKEMLRCALEGAYGEGAVHATTGNLNNHIGLPLVACAADESATVVVLEMGMNHLREIERLCEIAAPEVGLITNVGTAHAGNVGGPAGVEQAKGELFLGVLEQGVLVVNDDDPACVRLAASNPRRQVHFGRGGDGAVRFTVHGVTEGGLDVTFSADEDVRIVFPVIGRHNAQNAAGALAVLQALGADVAAGARALAHFAGVPGRLRVTRAHHGALVVDDTYNANPDSARAAVDALVDVAGSRRPVLALGPMLELGDDAPAMHRAVGRYAVEQGVAQVFSCGELGRAVLDGAREAGLRDDDVVWAEDSTSLAARMLADVDAGDAVLVKGSRGARMERVVELLTENA